MSPGSDSTTTTESSSSGIVTQDDTAAAPTSSSPSTTTGDLSTTEPDGTIFPIPDLCGLRGARCSQASCDMLLQDCPEGHKCIAYADDGGSSWNANRCVPVHPEPDLPGQPCTTRGVASGIDSCDATSMCWDIDPSTCVPFCQGTHDDPLCPEGSTCAVYGVTILCLQSCDPLLQDCPGNDLCIGNGDADNFVCVLDASGEDGQLFDACEFQNACDPGLLCVNVAYASECDPYAYECCLPFCDLTLPPNCPGAMQTCQPYFGMDPAPPEYENVGFCALPLP